ncbi:hypothetical protein CVT91_09895 [Candidatus Atribacteria bacterium HGW-Atribacteria-1]|nr:MAG: hypothetical protein CVT91_09895 [Candidatus Atribacteria bacterium HGW-Atribacteria-1]
MKRYFGFLDDTGVLEHDPNQRFFGLGLLKLEETAPFYQEVATLKDKVVSFLPNLKKPFEFKFNKINKSNYRFYYELLEIYFSFPKINACIFVVDKMGINFDFPKYFISSWEAYIGYSKLLIKNNLGANDEICIIADFHQKPKSSNKYYETEVRSCNMSQIYNVCMIESHASLYVQMIDVLIGAVNFDFKNKYDKNIRVNKIKKGIVNYLKKKLGVTSLAKNITIHKPNYFSVWLFDPKKNASYQRS